MVRLDDEHTVRREECLDSAEEGDARVVCDQVSDRTEHADGEVDGSFLQVEFVRVERRHVPFEDVEVDAGLLCSLLGMCAHGCARVHGVCVQSLFAELYAVRRRSTSELD